MQTLGGALRSGKRRTGRHGLAGRIQRKGTETCTECWDSTVLRAHRARRGEEEEEGEGDDDDDGGRGLTEREPVWGVWRGLSPSYGP